MKKEHPEGGIPVWRIGISIASGFGWLIFLVVWLFFYADRFSLYQNIGIFLASLLVVGLVNALAWFSFGMKNRWCS